MRRLEFYLKALCLLIGIGLFALAATDTPDPTPRLLDVFTLTTISDCDMTTTTFPSTTTTELLTTETSDDDQGTDTATPRLKDICQDASVQECDKTTTSTTSTTSVTPSSVTSTTTESGSSSSSSMASSSSTGTTSTTAPGTTTSVISSSTQKETSTISSPMNSSTVSSSTPSSPWFTRTTESTEESEKTEETEKEETETTGTDSTTTGAVSSTSTVKTTSGTSVSSSTLSSSTSVSSSISTTPKTTETSSTVSSTSRSITPSDTTTAEVTNATTSFRKSTASSETSEPSSTSAGSTTTTPTSVTSSEAKTSTTPSEWTTEGTTTPKGTSTTTTEWISESTTMPTAMSTTTMTPKSSTATSASTTEITLTTTSRKTTGGTISSTRTSKVTATQSTPRTTEMKSTDTTRPTPEETTSARTSTEKETSETTGLTSDSTVASTTVTTTQPEGTNYTETTLSTSTTVTQSTPGTQGTTEETSSTPWTTSTVERTTTSEEDTTVKETTSMTTTTVPSTSSDLVMTETTSQPMMSTVVTTVSVSAIILTNSMSEEPKIHSTTGMERIADEGTSTEKSYQSTDMRRTKTTDLPTIGTTDTSTTTDASSTSATEAMSAETTQMTDDSTKTDSISLWTSSPTEATTELASTSAELTTMEIPGSTEEETATTEDERSTSALTTGSDRTTTENETPLQTSTIPTTSVTSSTASTGTKAVSTTVTSAPTIATDSEITAMEATPTEGIQSTRATTTDAKKPSTSTETRTPTASSTTERTTPTTTQETRTTSTSRRAGTTESTVGKTGKTEAKTTDETKSTAASSTAGKTTPTTTTTPEMESTRLVTIAEEKTTSTAASETTTTEKVEKMTGTMSTARVTTEQTEAPTTWTRTTEEATTDAETGTSRLTTAVKSSLETMMDTETTESTTTTMTTTEATTTDCPGECPEGWIVGGDRCYLHMEPGVNTVRVAVAKAYCFHLGSYVGLAKQGDMIRDRVVLWAAMAEKNLTTELFHLASENYVEQDGILMGQAINLSKLIYAPDYIPVDESVEANALCVIGKNCGNLNCDLTDLFDGQFRYLPEPPKNLVLPHGQRASFPCLPPSPDSMSVTCGARGFLVPKVASLKCRYPVGFTPFAGNHRNNENRTNCGECWERGTEDCVEVEGNKFQCVCKEGWHGFTCRKTWNRCEVNKGFCLNGGSCVHRGDHVICNCPEGFIGTRCTLGVRNITIFGTDTKLGLLGFSTAGTMLACAGIAALFILMKLINIWSSLEFLPLVQDRTCPQDTYIYMRNLMLLLAKTSMMFFGRPDFILQFDYLCKIANVWIYYLFLSAILFLLWEAINVYEVLMELGSVEWGVDGKGDRRFLYSSKFRLLSALVGPLFIVIPYAIVLWSEISWDHTCLGGMANSDFDSFSTLHWLMGTFVWCTFCTWIYTLYMRKQWPEVYLQLEHQTETKRPTDTDKLERIQRNIHFPMILSLSTWIFYMTSIGSYFFTGQEQGTTFGWANIIASLLQSAMNLVQFVLIDDDALEELMKIGVPLFPSLPWPRETPPRRFTHEELIAMKTGAPCEWKFHPSTTWYLSEPMRHSMHRKLASEYLKRRAAGKKIPDCLETAQSWLADFVGQDPFSKQRTAVVEEFLERVREFDAEEIELEETEARAKGLQLMGIIHGPHLTLAQKRRRRKIKKDMGMLAEVLNYRFFPLEVGCTLEVLEDGGDLPGDESHWESKKPEHLPARMRHQLPYFRQEFGKLMETLPEQHVIREEYRTSEWSPGFEGMRRDPNPFLLPGLAPYVELAFYDQHFNLKEAKELADRSKREKEFVKRHNEELQHHDEIEKNKKIRKEVAARRRAEGVSDVDTDDDWHVAPFDCPNGPPPGFKKPVVTPLETAMKRLRKQQKKDKKKQQKNEQKEKLQSIPRTSRK